MGVLFELKGGYVCMCVCYMCYMWCTGFMCCICGSVNNISMMVMAMVIIMVGTETGGATRIHIYHT